jgi:uncharacterized protein (TIGR00369 family)
MIFMSLSSESFTPQDPDFESRVRESFNRQAAMQTIGATLESVAPGMAEIHLPYDGRLTQQNGYLHAGIVTMIVDSACGYAALTLAPPGVNVLTVEYKANFMAPAQGETFVATGRVLKAGKTLTVCQGEVRAQAGGSATSVAAMLATIMILRPS